MINGVESGYISVLLCFCESVQNRSPQFLQGLQLLESKVSVNQISMLIFCPFCIDVNDC